MSYSTPDLIARLKEIASDICPRCHMGHVPNYSGDGQGEWAHGSDLLKPENDGVQYDIYAPPEPCDASPVWEFINDIENG